MRERETTSKPNHLLCDERAQVVAYLDGELDSQQADEFERHARLCALCSRDLAEQRRLLCTLNMAFVTAPDATLPGNFSQIVMARAQSDMGGMRGRGERWLALKICLLLGIVSTLLLGAATGGGSSSSSSSAVIALGASLIEPLIGAAKILQHAAIYAGSAALIILRAIGRQISSDPQSRGLILLVLFAGALTLLPCLIINYHRTRQSVD
ncbi:MAG: hypothetical protein WKF84_21500 [Pyrinomonadaceae bacterium]